jgi:hypothetical protein
MSDNAQSDTSDEMLPEYDFTNGVRGKHHEAHRRGYKVIVHKRDGTIEERDIRFPDDYGGRNP